MAEKDVGELPLRDRTLKIDEIDEEQVVQHINELISRFDNDHEEYFKDREEWLEAQRDLQYQAKQGPFSNSSNLHVPLTLTLGKATHARLWSIFGQQMNFFAVESLHQAFQEKEDLIRRFMNWTLNKWVNRGEGARDVFDAWLNDIVFEGSGVIKLFWERWVHTYKDVVEETEIEDELVFDPATITSQLTQTVRRKQVDKEQTDDKEGPRIGRVLLEDFRMPPGFDDPQTAPWVCHDIHMTDEQLKERARDGKFDSDIVEEVISRKTSRFTSQNGGDQSTFQQIQANLEGVQTSGSNEDSVRYDNQNHLIREWYGKIYVKRKVTKDDVEDIEVFPREVVVWMHDAGQKILGWTYLHRISPSGQRPFFKADYIPARYRSYGIGVSELLYSINNYVDAVHNTKMDSGTLSSLNFGFYRAGSTLKPDTIRLQPGELYPLEDVNDVRFANLPFLANFGNQEEAQLTGYATRLLSISDLQLGQTQGVSGALRNATGATILSRESQTQLNIHFDRIARALNKMLNSLFVLSRERISNKLVFRVTGEDGKPVYGEVSREDLKGDFDFDISVDILGASESEKQQRAVLMLQTLFNPLLLQTGIVTPSNIFNALKEFVKVHGIKKVDELVTQPPQFEGRRLTPEQRIFNIVVRNFSKPPIEETVRLDEDHLAAIDMMEKFKQSDEFGLFTDSDQVAAFEAVLARHRQLASATQAAGAITNQAGLQISPESIRNAPQQVAAGEQSALTGAEGEVNGPVV